MAEIFIKNPVAVYVMIFSPLLDDEDYETDGILSTLSRAILCSSRSCRAIARVLPLSPWLPLSSFAGERGARRAQRDRKRAGTHQRSSLEKIPVVSKSSMSSVKNNHFSLPALSGFRCFRKRFRAEMTLSGEQIGNY
jgi:hypothetical protein